MTASWWSLELPSLCACWHTVMGTVRTATELGDPYQPVGAEKSPSKLAGNVAAYICLHFLNPSSKHLDVDEFEFPT